MLVDVPAEVTHEEGHTGFLIHLPSAVLALIFPARRIQPSLSLVDRACNDDMSKKYRYMTGPDCAVMYDNRTTLFIKFLSTVSRAVPVNIVERKIRTHLELLSISQLGRKKCHRCLKKNQNAPRPSEHPPVSCFSHSAHWLPTRKKTT